jgi:hypothetical protein
MQPKKSADYFVFTPRQHKLFLDSILREEQVQFYRSLFVSQQKTASTSLRMSGPLTPSLRQCRPCTESGTALRAMFECCDTLPSLLVSYTVGDYSMLESMLLYARLNKRFQREVFCAVQQWCKNYQKQKLAWLKHCMDKSLTRRAYLHLSPMMREIDRAFGAGFFDLYGRGGYAASNYTPHSYMAMARRRCVICKNPMVVESTLLDSPGFCFAHGECQRKHCIRRPVFCIALCEHVLGSSEPIRSGWHEDQPVDAATAMVLYAHNTPRTKEALRSCVSTLVLNRNDWTETVEDSHCVTLWLRPYKDIVVIQDTLMGALGLDSLSLNACFEKARRQRELLVTEREKRVKQIRQEQSSAVDERRAELRLAMGSSNMRWRTPESVAAFHPNAWELTQISQLLCPGRQPPSTERVIGRVRFLDRMLGDPNLSRATVDFFLNDVRILDEYVPHQAHHIEASSLPGVAQQIDCLKADKCAINRVQNLSSCVRVISTTRWHGGGQVRLMYTLSWHVLWMAGARLEEQGFDAPHVDTESTPDQLLDAMTAMVTLSLDVPACRGNAYELLGLGLGLSQLVQQPQIDQTYNANYFSGATSDNNL